MARRLQAIVHHLVSTPVFTRTEFEILLLWHFIQILKHCWLLSVRAEGLTISRGSARERTLGGIRGA